MDWRSHFCHLLLPSVPPSCRTSLTPNPSAGGFRWRKVKLLTVWSRCFHKWRRVALHYGRPFTLSMSRLLRLARLVPMLSPSVCLSSLPKVCDVAVIPKEACGLRLMESLRVIMLWSVKKSQALLDCIWTFRQRHRRGRLLKHLAIMSITALLCECSHFT